MENRDWEEDAYNASTEREMIDIFHAHGECPEQSDHWEWVNRHKDRELKDMS